MILITGATGNVGEAVIHAMPDKTVVRAGVRNIEKAQQQLNEPIDYVCFDFADPTTFPAALDGVTGLFLLRPPAITDADIFKTILSHAKDVEHVVFLSLQGIERVSFVPHAKIEQAILEAGIPYTFLRAGFFMQNLNTTHYDDIAGNDEIMLPAGKSKTAFIDVRDIGSVAAHVLTEPGHENQAYVLTGSEALDYFEVAQIFSEELQRPIRYPNPSLPRFAWHMWRRGFQIPYILVTSFLYTMTRFGQAKAVSPTVEEILDRPPITMRQYVRDYWT